MKVLPTVGKKGEMRNERMSSNLGSKLNVVFIACIRVNFTGWFNILYLVADQKAAPHRQAMGKVVDDISQQVQVSTDLGQGHKRSIEADLYFVLIYITYIVLP